MGHISGIDRRQVGFAGSHDAAIVLSRGSSANDTFRLYAHDIMQRPLRAELVTISACYGAGTRTYSGEGLVGLAWAFLRAGAHNVVAALWDASDVSTAQLMDKVYDEISKGESPDVALRKAKLSLLRTGSAFRKPCRNLQGYLAEGSWSQSR